MLIRRNNRTWYHSVSSVMPNYTLHNIAFIVLCVVTYSFAYDGRAFPKNFLLGTATSAYQTEGGWNENGKGENLWDRWTHDHPELVFDHSNGDVACDSYHKYKEDVQLLKDIGVDFYRFSLSWSRILPNGYSNVINPDGINYYHNLINELFANGIEPFVTLYHFDHPQIFEDMGGWTNELMVDWISDFARVVFKEFGPKIKYFMTINEPSVICDDMYGSGQMAPGKKLGLSGRLICMHNILKAHAKIYHIYDTEFRSQQNGTIGIVLPCNGAFPKTPNDTAAVDVFFQFTCGWMAHPIFSKTGDYPEIMKSRIAENSKIDGFPRSLLPEFSPKWIQYIKGTSDFFALNHYTSRIVETVPRSNGEEWYNYSGMKASIDPSWPTTCSSWLRVVPSGFRQILNQITTEYNHPPIYIMENGMSDTIDVIDHKRISYLNSYMSEMLSAIYEDGCDVKGYAVWSLLDNFEWSRGYSEKFGMVAVNFTDPFRMRSPRLSMSWFKNVIQTRMLQPIFDIPIDVQRV